MKNKLKFISGGIILILVGFGLGRWSMEGQIQKLENRVAVLEELNGKTDKKWVLC